MSENTSKSLAGRRASKEELQTTLVEPPKAKGLRNGSWMRSKWLRLLLAHVLASYLTAFVLHIIPLYTGDARNLGGGSPLFYHCTI